jgi:hypothetical protein
MFFRRCLVVHVDLALIVWSYAFIGALYFALPARNVASPVSRIGGVVVATVGVVMIILGAAIPNATPVLANYVPVIDTPVFVSGLAAFAIGLAMTFMDGRLLPGGEGETGFLAIPGSARPGIRAAALAVLVALVTFAISRATMAEGLDVRTHHELLFWGAGHVLQFALEAAMLSVWVIVLGGALGKDPVGRNAGAALFAVLVLPILGAPLLAAAGTSSTTYHVGFTRLMRWGIFPVVSAFLVICVRAVVREMRAGRARELMRDVRVVGFFASAALAVAGFVVGAMIRGSNTLVPAHYHASVGAVTVSFMTMTYVLLDAFGVPIPTERWKRLAWWQPLLHSGGQLAFVAGFALAGSHGMPRKTYGAEQHVRGAVEYIGMSLMGIGGLVAAAGALLFLAIVFVAWRRRPERLEATTRSHTWKTHPDSIPSRG